MNEDIRKLELLIRLRELDVRLAEINLEREKLEYNQHLNKPLLSLKRKQKNGNDNGNSHDNKDNGISNFGQENCQPLIKLLSDIDLSDVNENIFMEIWNQLHFNPDYPENHNIEITHQDNQIKVKIYLNNRWNPVTIDELLNNFIPGNMERLEHILESKEYQTIQQLVESKIVTIKEQIVGSLKNDS